MREVNIANVTIVDTHCHLWRKELSSRTWLTPELKLLFRTFEPADLEQASGPVGVRACVVIEAGKTTEENVFLQQMAASCPLIAAFVPYLDLESSRLAEELDCWQQEPKFRGLRMGFEGHKDPDVLKRPGIIKGLKEIALRGIVFEFLVQTCHLNDILSIYEEVSELNAVIEHMAKADMQGRTDHLEWQRHMRALARHTNVACKLSLSPRIQQFDHLLANPNQGWPAEAIGPYVDFLIEHFGFNRLMWGSDWPVCLLTADYQDTWNIMNELLADIGKENCEKIFRNNAVRFYQLNL